jgi:stearoyl-CoA desaturase (delta-9 desaturase)
VLWANFARIVFGLHATWAVNSATHIWGKRRFDIRDDSRNTWWVAIISFGEGWHNNHHAHPTSARHGLAWYEFDPSWLLIKVLKRLGLAKAIHVASVDTNLTEVKAA